MPNDVANRIRTIIRMYTHMATGAILVSLDDYNKLLISALGYILLQVIALVLDFVSPPDYKKNSSN